MPPAYTTTGTIAGVSPVASYDVERIRAHFPALRAGVAHFDGPGGTQTPDVVGRAIYDTITAPLSNRGDSTVAERNAEHAVQAARAALADLLGTPARGIVFGRSMTQLTFDLARTVAKTWGPGDEVVVSRLDHDANVRTWVSAAQAAGATVRWADFDPGTAELLPEHVTRVLSPRTKLVAVTAASNLLGTIPDLPTIAAAVRDAGAWLYVDGVHYTPHTPVDIAALGADFFVCSPYKFLGPHCGVLAARVDLLEQLRPDKLLPSTDTVPERYELGTLPYELMAGTTAAIDFLAALAPGAATVDASRRSRILASMAALEAYESELLDRLESAITDLPGVRLYSVADRRTPTLLVGFADTDPRAVRDFLAARAVNAPVGSFYAYEPARRLGLGEVGALRVGLAPYTTADEIDRLLAGLREFLVHRRVPHRRPEP
jgi:cysteine desulfurase family protein (TIGR01976 family)